MIASMLRKPCGFTLVEVLVALGIFSILSTGYLIVAGGTVRNLGQLQDKTFALWLAQDTVTAMRTFDAKPSVVLTEQKIEFLERDWVISFQRETTAVKSLVRIHISVALAQASEYPLATLETYFIEGPFVPQAVQ